MMKNRAIQLTIALAFVTLLPGTGTAATVSFERAHLFKNKAVAAGDSHYHRATSRNRSSAFVLASSFFDLKTDAHARRPTFFTPPGQAQKARHYANGDNSGNRHRTWRGRGLKGLGHYGIQMAYLHLSDHDTAAFDRPTTATVVPLPAGAWLFISGLLAVTGVGVRRKLRH